LREPCSIVRLVIFMESVLLLPSAEMRYFFVLQGLS